MSERAAPPPAPAPPRSDQAPAATPATLPQEERPLARRARGRRDIRTVLSIGGPVFFLPPALALADRDFTVFGVPTLIVYVFTVWLLGIVLIAVSSRHEPFD